jgi:hypothetical protein
VIVPKSYPPEIIEAWATWQVMRKCGFRAEDIFWIFAKSVNAAPFPGIALSVELRAQGKTMNVAVSKVMSKSTAERLKRLSEEFMADLAAKKIAEAELQKALEESYIWKNRAGFIATMLGKGIEVHTNLN